MKCLYASFLFHLFSQPKQSTDRLGGIQAWSMWLVAQLFALLQFSLQLSPGAMVQIWWIVSCSVHAAKGILSSVYYYVYVSLQTPVGMLLDRFGPSIIKYEALVCGIGCFLFEMLSH